MQVTADRALLDLSVIFSAITDSAAGTTFYILLSAERRDNFPKTQSPPPSRLLRCLLHREKHRDYNEVI
jgi:hypothetical protein